MYATSPWVGHLASCRLRCHFLRRQTMIAHSEPVRGRNLVRCLDGTSNELGRNRTNVAGINAVACNCCADRSACGTIAIMNFETTPDNAGKTAPLTAGGHNYVAGYR